MRRKIAAMLAAVMTLSLVMPNMNVNAYEASKKTDATESMIEENTTAAASVPGTEAKPAEGTEKTQTDAAEGAEKTKSTEKVENTEKTEGTEDAEEKKDKLTERPRQQKRRIKKKQRSSRCRMTLNISNI